VVLFGCLCVMCCLFVNVRYILVYVNVRYILVYVNVRYILVYVLITCLLAVYEFCVVY